MLDKSNTIIFSKSNSRIFLIVNGFKRICFAMITKNSVNYFLRGKDIISISPQTSGVHEAPLTSLIHQLSEMGQNDFLLDIGANIGLSSCQNGQAFKHVIAFEPNPLCVYILRVNTAIALGDDCLLEINPYGLGNSDEQVSLIIPKHNWGGAFINHEQNSYDKDTLFNKDGLKIFDKNNYIETEVKIRDTYTALLPKFAHLKKLKMVNGVIKIDVEGFEATVIKGIAASLPKEMKVTVIFENHDENLKLDEILSYFADRETHCYILRNHLPYKVSWPILVKLFCSLLKKSRAVLVPYKDGDSKITDIVIDVV